MNEREAREWLQAELAVSRETIAVLEEFRTLLTSENQRQNLVAEASLASFWVRHVVDSAQLLVHRPSTSASWIDLGAGAGFPGLIVALLHQGPVTLVEERKLRVAFLRQAADVLGVSGKTEIVGAKVERAASRPYDVISARAFAPLPKLLALGTAFSTTKTRWLLPKGRNAQVELEAAESSWQGDFRLEPSITDPEARIIVAERVQPRGKRARR